MESYSTNLKKAITDNTDFLPKGISQSKLKTDDIFTNLTIYQGERPESHRQANSPQQSQERHVEARKVVNCCEIFQDENAECNPKLILVTGDAGIGKTLFANKLLRDFSSNTLDIPGVKISYVITFRQIVRLANKELTLKELLNRSPLLNTKTIIDETVMQSIIDHPEQLFVVLDGFDEFKDNSIFVGDYERS